MSVFSFQFQLTILYRNYMVDNTLAFHKSILKIKWRVLRNCSIEADLQIVAVA